MAKIHFYNGVGDVTGANFLLDTGALRILVDCGLIQGNRFALETNNEPFAYDPDTVDVLCVTHAHADHIGRIPKLTKDGFRGVIYSTLPTRDLAALMLQDAYKVMVHESEQYGIPKCYELKDIDMAMSLWKAVSYHEVLQLGDDVEANFTSAGHILGSAMVTLSRHGKKFLFTGDIGNIPQPLLDAPEIVEGYDYLLMESVYGDRRHEEVDERSELLKSYIEDTRKKGGTLIIPAFSLERTQGMLLEINNFVEQGVIEPIPVFLDSPLAISVTELYKKHLSYLSTRIQAQVNAGDDIFDFPKLSFTSSISASEDIAHVRGPKIIIAGSGMSHGGRILMHEKRYLEDPKTTLLLVGYQSAGSLGRLLHDGAKRVRIDGEEVRVHAKIARIQGYSGHADRDQLVEFVSKGCDNVKQVFVTMGEERASLFLVQRLRDYLSLNAVAPELGEEIEIDF